MQQQWFEITGTSYIADVRLVKGQLETDREIPLEKAVKELCKYTVKFAEVEPEKLVYFWEAMKGRHVTQRYGVIRKKAKSESEVLNDFTCRECGQHEYEWRFVPFEIAYQPSSERGPPEPGWLDEIEQKIIEEWKEKRPGNRPIM